MCDKDTSTQIKETIRTDGRKLISVDIELEKSIVTKNSINDLLTSCITDIKLSFNIEPCEEKPTSIPLTKCSDIVRKHNIEICKENKPVVYIEKQDIGNKCLPQEQICLLGLPYHHAELLGLPHHHAECAIPWQWPKGKDDLLELRCCISNFSKYIYYTPCDGSTWEKILTGIDEQANLPWGYHIQ